MEHNHLLALKEITPDPIGFDPGVTSRLKRMVYGISAGYLVSMNYGFQIPYTSGLLLYIENSDSKKSNDGQFTFSPGNEHSPSGAAHVFLSETKLLSLDDGGKASLILDLLQDTLLKIANRNEHAAKQFDEAYQSFLKHEFYYNTYPPYKSPDEKYIGQIQSKEKWGSADHRLAVTDINTQLVSVYSINTTPYVFFDELTEITEENKWDIILTTVQIFYPLSWEGNNLILYWGREKYRFDPEEETIYRS